MQNHFVSELLRKKQQQQKSKLYLAISCSKHTYIIVDHLEHKSTVHKRKAALRKGEKYYFIAKKKNSTWPHLLSRLPSITYKPASFGQVKSVSCRARKTVELVNLALHTLPCNNKSIILFIFTVYSLK